MLGAANTRPIGVIRPVEVIILIDCPSVVPAVFLSDRPSSTIKSAPFIADYFSGFLWCDFAVFHFVVFRFFLSCGAVSRPVRL